MLGRERGEKKNIEKRKHSPNRRVCAALQVLESYLEGQQTNKCVRSAQRGASRTFFVPGVSDRCAILTWLHILLAGICVRACFFVWERIVKQGQVQNGPPHFSHPNNQGNFPGTRALGTIKENGEGNLFESDCDNLSSCLSFSSEEQGRERKTSRGRSRA